MATPLPAIRISKSDAWFNKENLLGHDGAYVDFENWQPSLEDAISHILAGGAVMAGEFNGTRSNENFQCAQLVFVDFDANISIADCLAIPFIRRYAAAVYPSASSRKVTPKNPNGDYRTRVVFVLSEPVEGAERYRIVAHGVCDYLGATMDEASYKPAQPWFGSTNRVEEPYINLDAVLPLELAGALTADLAAADYAQERRHAELLARRSIMVIDQASAGRREKYAAAAMNGDLVQLANAPTGTRNNTIFDVALSLFSKALSGDWPGIDVPAAQRELEAIVSAWPNVKKSLGTIERARKAAKPKPLVLPDDAPAPRVTPRGNTVDLGPTGPNAAPVSAIAETPQLSTPTDGRISRYCNSHYAEYGLLELCVKELGQEANFTVGGVAEHLGVSVTTVQRWIDTARKAGLVGFSTNLQGMGRGKEIPRKNVEKSYGRPATAYRLTPALGDQTISDEALAYELWRQDAPHAGRILSENAIAAGLDIDTATAIDAATSMVADTKSAARLAEHNIRRAEDRVLEIERLAAFDETPFTPDSLPTSATELRVMLLEKVIAAKPGKTWLQADLAKLIGVKKSSVSKLIAKSTKIVVSAEPVLKDFPLSKTGADAHKEVEKLCRENGGAAVSWGDEKHNVICGMSAHVPKTARSVKLNLGKTYALRAEPVEKSAPVEPVKETPIEEPTSEQIEARVHRKARAAILPRLKGYLLCRGWRYVSGPYGFWMRGGETADNTFDALVGAVLSDYTALKEAESMKEVAF